MYSKSRVRIVNIHIYFEASELIIKTQHDCQHLFMNSVAVLWPVHYNYGIMHLREMLYESMHIAQATMFDT